MEVIERAGPGARWPAVSRQRVNMPKQGLCQSGNSACVILYLLDHLLVSASRFSLLVCPATRNVGLFQRKKTYVLLLRLAKENPELDTSQPTLKSSHVGAGRNHALLAYSSEADMFDTHAAHVTYNKIHLTLTRLIHAVQLDTINATLNMPLKQIHVNVTLLVGVFACAAVSLIAQ